MSGSRTCSYEPTMSVSQNVILCDVSEMALLSHIPRRALTHQFGVLRCDAAMTKTRQQELSEKFTEQWQRSRDWLVPFMQNNQPKFLTKDELRSAAMRELNVSKSAFDFGWMAAIEDTGRHDWYEPLRRRLRTKS
jgi:hypothetical protein